MLLDAKCVDLYVDSAEMGQSVLRRSKKSLHESNGKLDLPGGSGLKPQGSGKTFDHLLEDLP
jgi:hypothetical protein